MTAESDIMCETSLTLVYFIDYCFLFIGIIAKTFPMTTKENNIPTRAYKPRSIPTPLILTIPKAVKNDKDDAHKEFYRRHCRLSVNS